MITGMEIERFNKKMAITYIVEYAHGPEQPNKHMERIIIVDKC